MGNSDSVIDSKSDKKANEFRELGNVKFLRKEFREALFLYNKSISYACTKNVRCLGFANRSAAYLELNCYKECLQNIEWARENDYPDDKLSKLDERADKCKKLMLKGKKNIAEDPWEFFKLSYPPNKKIPFIVDRLEMKTTEKYGRGIYATKDLKAGDIICIEDPVIFYPYRGNHYYHCYNCYTTSMNLIPCNQTASFMFCSTNCMEAFYSKKVDMDKALRDDMIVLPEIAASFGGYKELDEFINKIDLKDQKKTIFDYDLSNPEDPEYRKNLMTCLLSLKPKIHHQFDQRIYDFVSNKTAYRILGIMNLNARGIVFSSKDQVTIPIGYEVTLFRSLVNHSCLENTHFVSVDNKNVGYVTRPIKAGEQLFFDYGEKILENAMRKEVLEDYNVKCECQNCLICSPEDLSKYLLLVLGLKLSDDFTTIKMSAQRSWHRLQSCTDSLEVFKLEYQAYTNISRLASLASFPY